MLLEQATRRWWTLVLRGLLVVAFGLLLALDPRIGIAALIFVFGVYSLADGFLALGSLMRFGANGGWLVGVGGALSILTGLVALLWPGLTAIAFFYLLAWWAILWGTLELVGAIAYSQEVENEWAIVLSGVLWVAFGVILLIWPASGMLAVLAIVSVFAIMRGITLVVAGFRLRRLHNRITTGAPLR
jgi:uncharacterized membrane protein HdeD (DUF308 family)